MRFDPQRHHRRSIRLPGYDYAQAGAYFVTMVTKGRECLFGQVVDGEMRLNDAGRMIERWWVELGSKYPATVPDVCVVMPNHFHGIVIITDASARMVGADVPVRADLRVCPNEGGGEDEGAHAGAPQPGAPQPGAPQPDAPQPGTPQPGADLRVCLNEGEGAHAGAPQPGTPEPGAPLPTMVQWFKTMTTNEYIRGVKTLGWTSFPGQLWQRNYYEHVIRDDTSLQRIREYIVGNPARWAGDEENPQK